MLNFNEFITESTEIITEAGVRMTKDKWRSAMDMVPREERGDFMKFAASVKNLYGIGSESPQDYYKVQAAFKSLSGAAPAAKASAAPKPIAKPKAETPKSTPAKEAPKKAVPGLKVNGKYGSIIGSGDLFKAIDDMIPEVRDNGKLYKAIEVYLDNLYKYREAQGTKPSDRETRHIGEIKVLLTTLRHHLVELSKQTGLSYNA